MAEDDSRGESAEQKLAMLDDLRQAERRAVSSRVAAVIAHLIGTPLHVIAGRASLIRGAPTDATVAENARRIEEQVDKLAKRIRALIDYLTAPEPAPREDSVRAVVDGALALYSPIAEVRGLSLKLVGDIPDASVEGTSALIVLTSLLSLATRVAPRGATSELSVTRAADGRVAFELSVPGLVPPQGRIDSLEPPEQPETANVEELQVLSVCSAIVRRNGGQLEVVAGDKGIAKIRYLPARAA
ncbi:MAG TPA: histidine kinase dimerization/phospho-acceptor domain-containing protein [Polyangiaceae bacterium]|nr:histidine kinase dimerization/phospho-acceptor domain-containing protein [Polyangiaceae bacterium]